MIAFVQANAPFFTWTGAVFVASVAIGLVLWAVSELWRWITQPRKCPVCGRQGCQILAGIERRMKRSSAWQ